MDDIIKNVIYVVTYWDFTGDVKEEPVVTVFNNKEAATKCYNHFKKYYPSCVLDETFLYSSFEFEKEKKQIN